MRKPFDRSAWFVLLDTVPDYIQKTFDMTEDGKFRTIPDALVVKPGEAIPEKLDFAVIIYHTSDWHQAQAMQLSSQLTTLYEDIKIIGIPVKQG